MLGITGASGFLGTSLLQRLACLGPVNVRALTRTLAMQRSGPENGLSWVQGDLQQPLDCSNFVSGLSAIIHLAHTNSPLTSNKHLPSDARANLLPLLNLIEAIRTAGSRPLVIFASSGGAIYGPRDNRRPFREDEACLPTTSYGIQKLIGEHYLHMAANNGWLTAVSLRISNAYGLLLPVQRSQGFIGVAVNRVLRGQPIRIFGNPDNVRDYVHVDDIARAIATALNFRGDYRVYNIGSGVGRSVRDVVALIQASASGPVDICCDSEPGDTDLPTWNVLDVERASRELDWRPEVSFQDGVRRLLGEHAL